VDFSLTDEQEMLRDTARTLLTKECTPAVVRGFMNDPSAAEELWRRHLREWVALGDGPVVDHCLFLVESGGVVLPGPYFPTSALFVPLLRAIGHPLADAAVAGEITGTVSMAGRSGLWQVNDESVHSFVLEADRVDQVAIVRPGPSVAVVPASTLTVTPIETLDATRRVFMVDVPEELDTVPIEPDALDDVVARATVALSAELVGVGRWLVDHSLAYAKEREQFGQPIGAFQGLQWKLVAMALDQELADAAVGYAAMTIDGADPDRFRAAHVAKAAAGSAARHAARDGMQVHGGIGFTWEHDLHLYLRRAVADDALLGPSTWHHDRLGDALLAP
jgi:alkylation response protein AidB-like acyl-CoA dehydrogenase